MRFKEGLADDSFWLKFGEILGEIERRGLGTDVEILKARPESVVVFVQFAFDLNCLRHIKG